MKHFLALMAAIAGTGVCQGQVAGAGQGAPALRQAVADSPAPPPAITPRQLTAEQRAELRRQLLEYSRIAVK